MPLEIAAIGKLFDSATAGLDNLITSGEERGKVRLDYERLKAAAMTVVIQGQSAIALAEAKSEHLITAIWRPVTMLSFVACVLYSVIGAPLAQWVLNWAAPAVDPLPLIDMPTWIGATIGVGINGYIVSRGAEKLADKGVLDLGRGGGGMRRGERRRILKQLAQETDPETKAGLLAMLQADP